MAWTYANWRSQTTDAARLAALNLYLGELEAAISPEMSSASGTISTNVIAQRIKELEQERDRLERRTQGATFVRTRVI